ncbi:MAG: site-specific integrase [Planctomycetota bacterium]
MASLELDPASGRYRIRFRYADREYKRSTHTKHRRVAASALGQVEETLRLLRLGMAEVPEVPEKVDPGDFIVSGARSRRERSAPSPVRTLGDLFRIYQQELPDGSKETRTLEGEKLHFKHLLRHLKAGSRVSALAPSDVQRYVELRSRDAYRGRLTGPDTIRKEISTLRLVWNWAKSQGYVKSPLPVDRVVYPKRDEKPPFMTLAEIRRVSERGGLDKRRVDELWESLYLTRQDVDALLRFVGGLTREPHVYPMFVLAAHTGMRRSELVRSEIDDLDFDSRTVLVREKKRSRKHAISYRRVPMSGLVERVFREHLSTYEGDGRTFWRRGAAKLTEHIATNHFKAALSGSEWRCVRGFHVLRHSFASNAAAEGVDQRMIDEWMGHQTEEMRRRYRHLAPEAHRTAIDSVYRESVA